MSNVSMNACSLGTTQDVAVSAGTPKPSKPENCCTRSATVTPAGSGGMLRSLAMRRESESNVYLRSVDARLEFPPCVELELDDRTRPAGTCSRHACGRNRISGPVDPPVNPGTRRTVVVVSRVGGIEAPHDARPRHAVAKIVDESVRIEPIHLQRRLARLVEVRIRSPRACTLARQRSLNSCSTVNPACLNVGVEIEDRVLGAQVDVVEARVDEIVAAHLRLAHDGFRFALLRLRAKHADRRQQVLGAQTVVLRVQQIQRHVRRVGWPAIASQT